jgi:hypothetical protein
MNLFVLEIPEETAKLAEWLEGHLVGPNLGDLVAELAAIHGTAAERGDHKISLGGDRTAVSRAIDGGLGVLTRPMLQTLLRNPDLLLQLQEIFLTSNSNYWRDKCQALPVSAAAGEQGWQRLQPLLAASDVVRQKSSGPNRARMIVRIAAAVAAAILVTSVGLRFFRPQPPQVAQGWGWNKPDAFPQNLEPKAYLQHLANAADEWFKKRPENKEDLAKRITQFRNGCDVLLRADHKPLAPADREWLKERCRTWSGMLDQHLADLNAGKDVPAVRNEADATIRKLVQALRGRLT